MRRLSWRRKNGKGPERRVVRTDARDLLDTPVDEARYVVFDTELTGLKPKKDSIVSIGAVRMTGGRIDAGDVYYRLVEPRTELTGRSVVIHGITPSDAAQWPDIDTLLPEFVEFCRSSVLVGHVVSIDLAFLSQEAKRVLGAALENPVVDTFALYRWLRKREDNTCAYYDGNGEDAALYALAERYQISVDSAHNALSDAFVTAQLFQRFLTQLPGLGIRTVRDLLRIAVP